MIFETDRLIIRALHLNDKEAFFDMMSNPNVMSPIPREAMDRETSNEHFEMHYSIPKDPEKKVWAIASKEENTFIGLAAFLKNNNGEDEIGYRLREKYWGVGYGTETAKGLIDYGFNCLGIELITADVYIKNEPSVKILDKFFRRDCEFYNKADQCIDRRYKLTKKEWL